jgi:hypothetical protein
MAVCYIVEPQDVKVETYDRVRADLRMDDNPPTGLIMHCAGAGGDGNWRVVEVWESTAAQQNFMRDRLGAALQKAGIKQPKITEIPLHLLSIPKALVAT